MVGAKGKSLNKQRSLIHEAAWYVPVAMKQHADQRPTPNTFRKAMIATGRAKDHAGAVDIRRIPNFDLDRTIFKTLEGQAARFVMTTRVAKEPHFRPAAAADVEHMYQTRSAERELPQVDPTLLKFMVESCDFDVEHADGSFLDHLYFCFEFSAHHFADHSALVMLLHSILGTGTNTFAMTAEQIPELKALLNDFDFRHIEAFPSVLRLLYDDALRPQLRQNLRRSNELQSVSFRRVIDNAPIEMSGEDFWIQLNYQLIHLFDFLPAANWGSHQNDTSFILFRDLYDLLKSSGKLMCQVDYVPAPSWRTFRGERPGIGGFLTTFIPVSLSAKMATNSVRKFSERIGHSLDVALQWS